MPRPVPLIFCEVCNGDYSIDFQMLHFHPRPTRKKKPSAKKGFMYTP